MPDPPINLAEEVSGRSATTIGLTWSDGAHDGGLPVLDYRINKRVQGGAYSLVAFGIAT